MRFKNKKIFNNIFQKIFTDISLISQKSAGSPKIQSICGSSDNGNMYDITQGEMSKQSSIAGLGYMTDSIQSYSQEDRTVSPESDSPKSAYKGEQNHKPSIIANAALQLQLLQQMDMTNQDLFSGSTPKGVSSQRHSHIPGSSINQRILEQSFNQAQYLYQSEQDKKKQEKNKKKIQIIGQTKNGSSQVIPVDDDPKRKKQIKIQSILKLDSDVENVFQSLIKTVTNYKDNKEEYQNAKEQYLSSNNNPDLLSPNSQLFNLQSPISPGTQKSSFFKRDFQISSKSFAVQPKTKVDNKVGISISVSGINNQDAIKIQDSNEDNIQNKFINNANLNWLVGQKNQMMDTFLRRNYRNISSDLLNRSPFSSFKDPDTSLTILSTAQTTQNFFHQRHNSNILKYPSSFTPNLTSQKAKDQLYVKVNPLSKSMSKQTKVLQSTSTNSAMKFDSLDLNDNSSLSSQQVMQKKLMRLTSSMAQGVDMNQKRMSLDKTQFNKAPLSSKNEYYTPISSSRKSKQFKDQASKTQSILQNLGTPMNKMQLKIK